MKDGKMNKQIDVDQIKPIPLKGKFYFDVQVLVKFGEQFFEIDLDSNGKETIKKIPPDQVDTWDQKTRIRILTIKGDIV
jgi:hypothetical protein